MVNYRLISLALTLAAGACAAQIMCLLETAKMNGLEPHVWLTDVLTCLPTDVPEVQLRQT